MSKPFTLLLTKGPRLVAEEVRKSQLSFEDIDFHLAAVYLGSTMTPERQIKEGVRNLIPKRKIRTNKGRRPTVHGKELGGPRPRKEGDNGSRIGKRLDTDVPEDTGNSDKEEKISKWYKYPRPYTLRKRNFFCPR